MRHRRHRAWKFSVQCVKASGATPCSTTRSAPSRLGTGDGFTEYKRAAGGALFAEPRARPLSFDGLPHGAVAACSGAPDGGSCYCGDFGTAYGYKGVPWGRYPGDGLRFYGTAPPGARPAARVCFRS